MGHTTHTALVTWAPEQDCPYLICLLLKTGMHRCFARLIHSADHILLFAIVFPMVKFALLLEFHSLLFSEHPQLSPDTHLSPSHYPVALGDESCPALLKPTHCHPPLACHQSHVWFIPARSKTSVKMGTGNQKKQVPILSGGETSII